MWFTFPAGWHILVQVSGYLSSFPVLFLTLIPFIPLPIFPMSYCFALVLELFAFSLSISPHRSLPFFFFFLPFSNWSYGIVRTPSHHPLARTPCLIIFLQELWLVCPAEKEMKKGTRLATVPILLALKKGVSGNSCCAISRDLCPCRCVTRELLATRISAIARSP